MTANDYVESMRYEALIRRAFNCERGSKNGASLDYMQNAMTMERGETFAKHLGTFDKQFQKVKDYTSKALIKLSKTKPYNKFSSDLIELDAQLKYISDTSSLMKIINVALDKITD
ncbi:MAG: hypothetical protein JWN78_2474 [Bacteroidota bacterium]|nr:hypothetical protein [Bacteroidota bacterium]